MKHRWALPMSVIILVSVFLSACVWFGDEKPNELNWKVQDFTFTDQDNQPFGLSDLKGKVWIANFFFSHCTTVCPMETANMKMIQDKLKEADVPAELVSFTVDPERDKPEVLKEYAKKYRADFSNWHFLSGYSFEEIKKFSQESFKSLVAAPQPGSDQFTHVTSFFLVNPEGVIVKKYEGYSETPFDQIVKDIKALQ